MASVERKLWQTRCCAQGAESGFMEDVQRWRGLNLAWPDFSFVNVVRKHEMVESVGEFRDGMNCKRILLFG